MSAPDLPWCWKCGVLAVGSSGFVKVPCASGWKVTAWCSRHDGLVDPKRAWWPARMFDLQSMPVRRSHLDSDVTWCKVCETIGPTEVHHLAPVEFFGAHANRWPTVEVCRTCHEDWHERMGQSIGHHPVGP